jgi:hypothetical protein
MTLTTVNQTLYPSLTYTVISADYMILCDASATGGTGFTVTLPAAGSFTGRSFAVKRVNAQVGAASSNRCNVTPVASATGGIMSLDQPNVASTNTYSSVIVVSDGTNWWMIGGAP